MPNQHDLPKGVLRWTPEFDGQRIEMVPDRDGGFVKLSDAPAIRAAAVEENERRWREKDREREDELAAVHELRAKAERERDSIAESYARMKVARTEALRERDAAVEEERERLRAWCKSRAEKAASQAEGSFGDERDVPEGEAAAYREVCAALDQEDDRE